MRSHPFRISGFVRAFALSSLALLGGCEFPADPEGTTDQVTGRILKVGMLNDPLDAMDAEAVARIAGAVDARAEFQRDDPHNLFASVEAGRIHLVAGRLPSNTPFKSHVALSNPIGAVTVDEKSEDRVLALRKGENRFLVKVNRAIKGMGE